MRDIYLNGRLLIPRAKWCATFASKFRGFMLHAPITPSEALVLVEAGKQTQHRHPHALHAL